MQKICILGIHILLYTVCITYAYNNINLKEMIYIKCVSLEGFNQRLIEGQACHVVDGILFGHSEGIFSDSDPNCFISVRINLSKSGDVTTVGAVKPIRVQAWNCFLWLDKYDTFMARLFAMTRAGVLEVTDATLCISLLNTKNGT